MVSVLMELPCITPWKEGCSLIWDVTCPDTLTGSYRTKATNEARAVATITERRKNDRYHQPLMRSHHFIPIVVETLGVLGQEAICFFKELGKRIQFLTSEPQSGAYLIQQATVALQHSNAASILGTSKCFTLGAFFKIIFNY